MNEISAYTNSQIRHNYNTYIATFHYIHIYIVAMVRCLFILKRSENQKMFQIFKNKFLNF